MADLVVSCAAFGPYAPWGGDAVVREMERCTAPGGAVAFVGPEDPAWFAKRGYRWTRFEVAPVTAPAGLAEFFGPRLQPPSDLLLKRT